MIADWRALWASPSKGGAHSRIIWSGAWLESEEGEEAFFVTASRDAKVFFIKVEELDGLR